MKGDDGVFFSIDIKMDVIKNSLLDEYVFERMKDFDEENGNENRYCDYTYPEFIAWNMSCAAALSEDELNWLVTLCKKIRNDRIRIMDAESCSAFSAAGIYFNPEKQLCIYNDR